MRSLSSTLVALLLAGCLGDLRKPAGEDGGPGGDGGGGDGAAPDGGCGGACPIAIRITSLVTDLDGNSYPDLVLLNDAGTPEDRGLLVYFDRADAFFSEPDQVLSTDSLHPLVATTGDFVGGARLDLMVIATAGDDVPYVVLFEGSADRSFTLVKSQGFPGRTITAGSVARPTPVFAARTFIRQSAASPPGLVFGDLDDALYISIAEDWTTVTASGDLSIATTSTTMNVALPVLSAQADRNDVLILDNQGGAWWQNAGTDPGNFLAGPALGALWADRPRAFFVFDYDGDELPDFMTLDLDNLRLGHVDSTDGNLDVDVRRVSASPVFGDGQGDALFAADVDGAGGIDLLILDDIEPGFANDERFILMAARNLTDNADGTTIDPESGRIDADDSWVGDPTRLVAGDFDRDGDVDVWVFDQTLGFKLCLEGEVFSGDMYRFKACD